jgi:hypothetical protein
MSRPTGTGRARNRRLEERPGRAYPRRSLGRVVDADTIEFVYRHSTPKGSVVAVTVWKRKK